MDHQVKADYDQALFLPRQRMIASGMYAPVIECIKAVLGDAKHLLDVGCGEGSFLAQLVNEKTQAAVGFDIAKAEFI